MKIMSCPSYSVYKTVVSADASYSCILKHLKICPGFNVRFLRHSRFAQDGVLSISITLYSRKLLCTDNLATFVFSG